jgi:hypothetical protein
MMNPNWSLGLKLDLNLSPSFSFNFFFLWCSFFACAFELLSAPRVVWYHTRNLSSNSGLILDPNLSLGFFSPLFLGTSKLFSMLRVFWWNMDGPWIFKKNWLLVLFVKDL